MALRLKGTAVETLKVEAEIDATDRLEFPDQNPTTTALGIQAPSPRQFQPWLNQ